MSALSKAMEGAALEQARAERFTSGGSSGMYIYIYIHVYTYIYIYTHVYKYVASDVSNTCFFFLLVLLVSLFSGGGTVICHVPTFWLLL